MNADTIAGLILGGIIGIPVGRAWAEIARVRFDMRKTWESRKQYRGK